MRSSREILKNVFGYSEFRDNQEAVISRVIEKMDAVVVMPTGGGKSLCYQIPALIFHGITVVVSPLISLMKDQVEQLREIGVPALFLNSALSQEEYNENVGLIKRNKVKLIYAAPETLLLSRTLNLLSSLKVELIAVDEAHCISEWGHDFRPEYRRLSELRGLFPSAAMMALTATATPKVREDIFKNLFPKETELFLSGFDRKNLFLEIIPKNSPFKQTLDFISRFPKQSGLIYCFSRRQVNDLCERLKEAGYSVSPYHAGLTSEERHANQEAFIRDNVDIIVATVAFGMGVDKPDIRFVLHYDLPKSVESYYQQIGRAGRDGDEAYCRLLFGLGDIAKIDFILKENENYIQNRNLLNHLVDYCEGEECRRKGLLAYFGETYERENCGKCDNCLKEKKKKEDLTVLAQKFLSCVVRTGRIFGASYIIQVLRGSKNAKVFNNCHDRLSVYGIGKELSAKSWNHLVRQFRREGLIAADEHGSLKITKKAVLVLKGEKRFLGSLMEEKTSVKLREEVEYDSKLFERLRKLRKNMADEMNLPPYVIFPDRTLREMSRLYPVKIDALEDIYGIGQRKKEKFGRIFVEEIKLHRQENHLDH